MTTQFATKADAIEAARILAHEDGTDQAVLQEGQFQYARYSVVSFAEVVLNREGDVICRVKADKGEPEPFQGFKSEPEKLDGKAGKLV